MHIRNPQATIIITTAAETPTPRNTCKFNFVDLVPGTTFSRGITALGAGELPGREPLRHLTSGTSFAGTSKVVRGKIASYILS
jgi:hypothetical protein